MPQNILFPFMTTTIIYWLANVNPDPNVFFMIALILVLTSNAAVGYGMPLIQSNFLLFIILNKIYLFRNINCSLNAKYWRNCWGFRSFIFSSFDFLWVSNKFKVIFINKFEYVSQKFFYFVLIILLINQSFFTKKFSLK